MYGDSLKSGVMKLYVDCGNVFWFYTVLLPTDAQVTKWIHLSPSDVWMRIVICKILSRPKTTPKIDIACHQALSKASLVKHKYWLTKLIILKKF